MQNYLRGHSESGRSLYVGDVIGWDAARGMAEVDVKNRFAVGDRLEDIIGGSDSHDVAWFPIRQILGRVSQKIGEHGRFLPHRQPSDGDTGKVHRTDRLGALLA
ncbi:hypothetical protein SDC9_162484 [bioreactor metagenome]|uniref:Peptidase family U32 C-terminal domain-containing protein n=1 Tax=bioreactor metagenome TaxID=1076179 RepID=A0A645FL82_9ZZZZ